MTDSEKLDLLLLKMEGFATKDDLKSFATKDDLKSFATKDDLKSFATKDDLKPFATKDDLKSFATKDDLKSFATKDDLMPFATKDDLKSFATKDDLKSFVTNDSLRHEMNLILSEIDSTEQRLNRRFEEVDKKILDLRNYVTSMRYSSEAVEILMKRQDNVEQRLQKVERKVLYS